jgi:hypothetical protein
MVRKKTYLNSIGWSFKIFIVPSNEKGLPVFGKQIIQKNQIPGTPGQDLAPDFQICRAKSPGENPSLPRVILNIIHYPVSPGVGLELEVHIVHESESFDLKTGIHDGNFFFPNVTSRAATGPNFDKTIDLGILP